MIGIFAVLNLSADPHITRLEFRTPSVCMGVHDLTCTYAGLPTIKALQSALLDPVVRAVIERLSGEPEPKIALGSPSEAYFSEPYVFLPNEWCQVRVSGEPGGPENFLLRGFVAEPIGMTIA
jgi:hypothetical protein